MAISAEKVVFKCPGCGKTLAVPAVNRGQRKSCPSCQTGFVIPLVKRPAPAIPGGDASWQHWQSSLTSADLVSVLDTMEEITHRGPLEAVPLLETAGCNLHDKVRSMRFSLWHEGTLTLDEYRGRCIRRLQTRWGASTPATI